MKSDCSWWHWTRRRWRECTEIAWLRWCEWRYGLPREAALDLKDGRDLGDHAVSGFSQLPRLEPRPPRPPRLLGPKPRPPKRPACPGLPTLEDLERLDREFLAGGPVTDAVVRGVLRDLRMPPQT